jgi:voltage-gated potassium channel
MSIIERICNVIKVSEDEDSYSLIYNRLMIVFILLSLVPLAYKDTNKILSIIELITVSIFIIDYIIRWLFYCEQHKKLTAVVTYPFTPFAIIDILSILPSISIFNSTLKLLRLFRLIRILRVLKFIRHSKSLNLVIRVIQREKAALLTVGTMAIGYILISGLVIFSIEPVSFNNFFDAVYWATTALTTVGYGDIYPVTTIGRVVSMISSFFGIAFVALPSGIITAGFMEELKK